MKHTPDAIFQGTQTVAFRSTGPAGALGAQVIVPRVLSDRPPLVVLHGISRNADVLATLFRDQAERTGRPVIVPHFHKTDWPHFQRPGPAARPDLALLALFDAIAARLPAAAGPFDLFGHSGGAQLAHRFGMLYPQRVGVMHLAAAGWYCLPDDRMPYPYGVGSGAGGKAALWARRKRAGLRSFLDRRIHLYIGSADTERDETVRQTSDLDRIQGRTRRERAHCYAAALRSAAHVAGLPDRVTLTELPGCSHDVVWAVEKAGLAQMVMSPAAPAPAQAIAV